MKNSQINIFLSLFFCFFTSQAQIWTQTNGPFGAKVTCVKGNDSILLSTVENRGLFISKDHGDNWISTAVATNVENLLLENDLIVATSLGELFFSIDNWKSITKRKIPSSDGKMYLHKGVLFIFGYWSGNRISLDTGKTWSNLNYYLEDVAFEGNTIYGSQNNVLKISHDFGKTWMTDTTVKGIVLDILAQKNNLWVLTADRLYHSEDVGSSLNQINSFSGDPNRRLYYSGDTLILISVLSRELSTSVDHGKNFTTISTNNIVNNGFNTRLSHVGKSYFRYGFGIYRSSNLKHWKAVDNGLLYNKIVWLKAYKNTLFYYSDYQFGLSSDYGNTWKVINDLDSSLNGWSAVAAFNDGYLIAADKNFGVHYSPDTGSTWKSLNLGGAFYFGGLAYRNGATYISYLGKGENVRMTADFGKSWQTSFLNNNFNGTGSYVSDILASSKAIIFARSNIYNSLDSGKTWNLQLSGVLSYQNYVYSGTHFYGAGCGLIRGSDKGDNWVELFAPATKCVRYVAAEGPYVICSTGTELLYSGDSGANWEQLSIPSVSITGLAIIYPRIFLGTFDQSVWVTDLSKVSVSKHQVESKIEFKNPVSDLERIIIHSAVIENGIVELYDLLGNRILTDRYYSNLYELDTRVLTAGIYILNILTESGKKHSRKIIRQ